MKYSFFQAEIKHYDDYYKIRSEEKNLYWTGYSSPPDYENFKEWFKQRLIDTDRFIYLMYARDVCLGSLHIDFYDDYAAVGYSVKAAHEGRGIGTNLVKEAVELVKFEKNMRVNLISIKAWINQSNVSSIKIVEKNGFVSMNKELRKRFGINEVYFEYVLNLQS
jgi:RimJ/RimL family protein N-acetyltransferase